MDLKAAEKLSSALNIVKEYTTGVPPAEYVRVLDDADVSPMIEVGNVTILDWEMDERDEYVSFWDVRFRAYESCEECASYERSFTYYGSSAVGGCSTEECGYCNYTFED